jgi:hypothetical protein
MPALTDTSETEGLVSAVVERAELSEAEIVAMWQLYAGYYDGTAEQLFRSDLAKKSHVLLSRDVEGEIQGFSTIELDRQIFDGREIGVVFSGDTIIDHRYWAKNDFAFCWIRFASTLYQANPELPLYWLLIVKGHRTYRYMSVFGKRWYPAPGWDTPASVQRLMDQLASERFGDAWNPETGLLHFEKSQGHLKPEWAEVPEAARRRKEVAFFLERNPDYDRGDELVCLCEISLENMKPLTKRIFLNEQTGGQ